MHLTRCLRKIPSIDLTRCFIRSYNKKLKSREKKIESARCHKSGKGRDPNFYYLILYVFIGTRGGSGSRDVSIGVAARRRNLSMGPSTLRSSSSSLRPPSSFSYFRFSPPTLHIYCSFLFALLFIDLSLFLPPTPTPSILLFSKPLRQLLFQPLRRAVAIRYRLSQFLIYVGF